MVLILQTNKATMVGVAIDHIKSLEVTLANLEKRKQEMKLARGRRGPADAGASSSVAPPPAPAAPTQAVLPVGAHGGMPPAAAAVTAAPALAPVGLQTWSGPNVVLTVSGDDAYVNVCTARRQGVMTMVAAVLEKHCIDVVTSEVASDDSRSMLMIHARVSKPLVLRVLGFWPKMLVCKRLI